MLLSVEEHCAKDIVSWTEDCIGEKFRQSLRVSGKMVVPKVKDLRAELNQVSSLCSTIGDNEAKSFVRLRIAFGSNVVVAIGHA